MNAFHRIEQNLGTAHPLDRQNRGVQFDAGNFSRARVRTTCSEGLILLSPNGSKPVRRIFIESISPRGIRN
jgi:hypothetical protein